MRIQALVIKLDPCIKYIFFSTKKLDPFNVFLGNVTTERMKSAISKAVNKGLYYTNVGVKVYVNNIEHVVFHGLLTYFEDTKGTRIARLNYLHFDTLSHSKAFVLALDMTKEMCSKTAEILIFEYIPDPVASNFFIEYGCVLNLIDKDVNKAAFTLIKQTKAMQSYMWISKKSPLSRLKNDKKVTSRNCKFTWFILLDKNFIHKDEIEFDCKCN
jgi:hypothetical protein